MPVDYSKFDAIEDSDEEKAKTGRQEDQKGGLDADQTRKMCQLWGHGGRPESVSSAARRSPTARALPKGRLALPQARVLPAQRLEKKEPSKPKPPKKTTACKVESSDDDDDEPLTWYKHRETKLPDSNVQHVKLPSTPSEENLNRKDSAGSAWNAAGTWEERDVLPKVRERIESVVKRVSDRDFGSGVISVDRVKSVTGDASVGVIRGKARQFLDVKIEVAFRVRVGGDEQAYKGTLILKDYSADAMTEPSTSRSSFPTRRACRRTSATPCAARWAARAPSRRARRAPSRGTSSARSRRRSCRGSGPLV